ncbi:MAG TPA: hypothetical protein VNK04_24835 [Gemmataceae bacterium]|nr:hypothetical protein [Gemmataceae bacterium]
MDFSRVQKVADAILYEGYALYPYRPSVKNRQRWTFGVLVPRSCRPAQEGTEAWAMQTECLAVGGPYTVLHIKVRFLHLRARMVEAWCAAPSPPTPLPPKGGRGVGGEGAFRPVEALQVGPDLYHTWQEAVEREVVVAAALGELAAQSRKHPFAFPPSRETESLHGPDGGIVGRLTREQQPVEGTVELAAEPVGEQVFKITLRIHNLTPWEDGNQMGRDQVLTRSLVSTHALLGLEGGEFVSLIDSPEGLRGAAVGCRNVGAWPVLAGEKGRRDLMLAAPIILYDYPQVAPESPGDLFDSTEIDELLALRILTLTDQEKQAMRTLDERTRALLERTEALAGGPLLNLHGAVRALQPIGFRPGDRVRLRPRGRADAFDLILAGKTATVASVEQDYEGQVHLAVILDDDPGRDLGEQGKPGHRFFFRPDEVELLAGAAGGPP